MKARHGIRMLAFVLLGSVAGGCGPVPEGRGGQAEVEALPVEAVAESGEGVQKAARQGPSGLKPEGLVGHDGRVFFSGDDGESGRELWMSPGESACAVLVKDIRPGAAGSVPRFLTPLGKWVYFVADDGVHGPELWRTDGTAVGTTLVKDVLPGALGAAPRGLTAVGERLYFTAEDREHGRELWRTDGTPEGTVLVHEFAPGPASLPLLELTAWEDRLALTSYADDEAVLWTVEWDDTARRVFATQVGVLVSLRPAGGRLFFLRDAGLDEGELWVTTAQEGGAQRLRTFPGELPSQLTVMKGVVYFLAGAEAGLGRLGDALHGGELWRSDGTPRGTRIVRDIRPGPAGSMPSNLVVMDGVLYFAADDGLRGRELWRTDGSLLGTWLVWDIEWGAGSSAPDQLVARDGRLFFAATTARYGREVWTSNGWFWWTYLLTDIAPGAASSDPRSFVFVGPEVFFLAGDGMSDVSLWALPLRSGDSCARPSRIQAEQ
ncbi:hypothetical protein LZ198_36775 [Myxococcus sp. K15C18031901]|uniref:ELWxxDGT repeat protein n=1 Tax=Myxococcus dinghuensis TaxID=2906761 RepID=UPI0020A7D87B|nr:ELWxxDGT repeat protein [Myxococcus dinghuensis]MCP3104433.1 hypothetical protein [Myxococcus dinghuensis]